MLLADEWDFLSVHGYGTLGIAYQDNKDVIYRSSFFTDKGTQGDISFDNHSVLGLQLDTKASDNLTFTVQAVASANNANGNILDVEWANVKYQVTDTFDFKVGMMRTPIFMYSDILKVAYSYDMLRLPDMYGLVSINKYHGLEFSHRSDINDVSIYSTVLYGEADSVYKAIDNKGDIAESKIHAHNIYGLTFKVLYNELMFRASYLTASLNINNKQADALFNQFNLLDIPLISHTIDKYKVKNKDADYLNFAAKDDFENSYLMGEYIRADSKSFIVDLQSWYIGGGYNFDTWTPFFMYSKTKSTSNYTPMSTSGLSLQLAGAVTGANQAFTQMSEPGTEMNLDTVSLGFRYDLSENAVFKFQYDEQKRLHETLNVFSSVVNFVF
jgi:hypothetical protein